MYMLQLVLVGKFLRPLGYAAHFVVVRTAVHPQIEQGRFRRVCAQRAKLAVVLQQEDRVDSSCAFRAAFHQSLIRFHQPCRLCVFVDFRQQTFHFLQVVELAIVHNQQ